MSAGTNRAHVEYESAKAWEQVCDDELAQARISAKEATEWACEKAQALDLAILISVDCPICDAKVDEPCHGIQPANHTARAVARRKNEVSK